MESIHSNAVKTAARKILNQSQSDEGEHVPDDLIDLCEAVTYVDHRSLDRFLSLVEHISFDSSEHY